VVISICPEALNYARRDTPHPTMIFSPRLHRPRSVHQQALSDAPSVDPTERRRRWQGPPLPTPLSGAAPAPAHGARTPDPISGCVGVDDVVPRGVPLGARRFWPSRVL
jgi:hypothetical protein